MQTSDAKLKLQSQADQYIYKRREDKIPSVMWFAEAAVDERTLLIAAKLGIKSIILRPSQAKQPIDSTRPYQVKLPGGYKMTVFFYDMGLSGGITHSEGNATLNADGFLSSLPRYEDKYAPIRLLAMDGETYGHHKEGADKFLSYLVKPNVIKQHGFALADLQFLAKNYPPNRKVDLHYPSSWSCIHGIDRWSKGCNCQDSGGFEPKRNWKQVVHHAIDNLVSFAYEVYEVETRRALPEPHLAREDYIRLRLGSMTLEDFWKARGRNHRMPGDKTKVTVAMLLLEAQYYLQEAQTSCAWYWHSYDRPEVRIILNDARRAMHLLYQATGFDYEPYFLDDLKSLGYYPPYMDKQSTASLPLSRFEDGYYGLYGKPHIDPLWQKAKQGSYTEFAQVNKKHRLERGNLIDGRIRDKEGNVIGGLNTDFLDNMHQALDEIFMYVFYAYLDIFLPGRKDLKKVQYRVELYSQKGNSLAGRSDGSFTVDGSGSRNGKLNNYQWMRFVLLHEIGHNNKGRIFKDWSEEAADTYARDAVRHIEQINERRYNIEKKKAARLDTQFMKFEEWERRELLKASGHSDEYEYGCLALPA